MATRASRRHGSTTRVQRHLVPWLRDGPGRSAPGERERPPTGDALQLVRAVWLEGVRRSCEDRLDGTAHDDLTAVGETEDACCDVDAEAEDVVADVFDLGDVDATTRARFDELAASADPVDRIDT